MAATSRIVVGDVIPDWVLQDHRGVDTRLSDLYGPTHLVLFFYPKDNTMGCTAEVCAFRDQYEIFLEAGAVVVGVSSDSVESHAGFALRQRLPFPLLSDRGGELRRAMGVPKALGLLAGRVTYIVERGGIVRHIFVSNIDVTRHVRDALAVIHDLSA